MILKYLKYLGISLGILLILSFLTTSLNYLHIINNTTINILNTINLILSLFIGGFLIGRNTNNKGYLEGIKFGGIYVLLIIIFNILIKTKFSIRIIILCAILLLSSMIGSMIGINYKKKLD